MSRSNYYNLFNQHFARFERERVKQVLLYFSKHAIALSSFIDFEVCTKNGWEFKRRSHSTVTLLLESFVKKNCSSLYLQEVVQKALFDLKQSNFIEIYLTDDLLELDLKNTIQEEKFESHRKATSKKYNSALANARLNKNKTLGLG